MEKIKDYNKSALFFEGCVSFITDVPTNTEYFHHCYKMVIGLDKCFSCLLDGQELNGLQGLIINQAVPHSLVSPDTKLLVCFIEIDSFRGWQLRGLLNGHACMNMNKLLSPSQLKNVMPANYNDLPDKVLSVIVKVLMETIFIMPPPDSFMVNKPMQLALQFVESNLDNPIEAEDIACAINMSTECFRYLFVQQMSIPFAQYILWKRIRKAITDVSSKNNTQTLSDTDLILNNINMNRIFKKVFGGSRSALLENSRFLI